MNQDMEKLIERLKEFKKHCDEFGYGVVEAREFGSILYHFSTPSTENKGGDKPTCDYREWLKRKINAWEPGRETPTVTGYVWGAFKEALHKYDEFTKCPASPKPDTTEPLACLADRKGWNIFGIVPMQSKEKDPVSGEYKNKDIGAQTQGEAESKAREYLSALPDIGGMK